jgi:hypothetical protein
VEKGFTAQETTFCLIRPSPMEYAEWAAFYDRSLKSPNTRSRQLLGLVALDMTLKTLIGRTTCGIVPAAQVRL